MKRKHYRIIESCARAATVTFTIAIIGAFGRVENGMNTWPRRFMLAALFFGRAFVSHEIEVFAHWKVKHIRKAKRGF